jgi:hypothetical protein
MGSTSAAASAAALCRHHCGRRHLRALPAIDVDMSIQIFLKKNNNILKKFKKMLGWPRKSPWRK